MLSQELQSPVGRKTIGDKKKKRYTFSLDPDLYERFESAGSKMRPRPSTSSLIEWAMELLLATELEKDK